MDQEPITTDSRTMPLGLPTEPGAPGLADDARDWLDHRASAQALKASQARQASGRRRFVDPTTCEREYSLDEVEFMQAMQEYKKSSGRLFPTWSEVLEVLQGLGYAKGGADPAGSG